MEHSGLAYMIKNNCLDDIALLFDMFSRLTTSFTLLKNSLSDYIVKEGMKLVADDKMKYDEYIAKLIDLRDKIMQILIKSFCRNPDIDMTIKNAFETFIN